MKFLNSQNKGYLLSIVLLALCVALFIFLFLPKETQQNISLLGLNDSDTINLQCGSGNFEVEIARSSVKKAKGYMDRQEPLSSKEGMLFIFDNSAIRSFWMKDTYVPLDILFLDTNLEVVTIHEDVATNQIDQIYTASSKSQYVLEIKAGGSSELDISVGTVCEAEL